MSNVGFGDVVAKTSLGRLTVVLCMFAGQFITSLVLLAMKISSKYSLEEERSFKRYKDFEYQEQKVHLAAEMITIASQLKLITKGIILKKFETIGMVRASTLLEIRLLAKVRMFKAHVKYLQSNHQRAYRERRQLQ